MPIFAARRPHDYSFVPGTSSPLGTRSRRAPDSVPPEIRLATAGAADADLQQTLRRARLTVEQRRQVRDVWLPAFRSGLEPGNGNGSSPQFSTGFAAATAYFPATVPVCDMIALRAWRVQAKRLARDKEHVLGAINQAASSLPPSPCTSFCNSDACKRRSVNTTPETVMSAFANLCPKDLH